MLDDVPAKSFAPSTQTLRKGGETAWHHLEI